MIYSCVMFNQEWDLLKVRMAEEHGIVDYWLLCQSDKTHTGLEIAGVEWPEWALSDGRIWTATTYVEDGSQPWANEAAQRDVASSLGLEGDDVLLVSDADEITCRVSDAVVAARTHEAVTLRQRLHYYKINYVSKLSGWDHWEAAFACTGQYLRDTKYSLTAIRQQKLVNDILYGAGHHFSYLMKPEAIATKLRSFAHSEYNCEPFTDPAYIAERIAKGEDLFGRIKGQVWQREEINCSYPRAIRENLSTWKEFIA